MANLKAIMIESLRDGTEIDTKWRLRKSYLHKNLNVNDSSQFKEHIITLSHCFVDTVFGENQDHSPQVVQEMHSRSWGLEGDIKRALYEMQDTSYQSAQISAAASAPSYYQRPKIAIPYDYSEQGGQQEQTGQKNTALHKSQGQNYQTPNQGKKGDQNFSNWAPYFQSNQKTTSSYGLSQQNSGSYGQSQQGSLSYGQSQQSSLPYGQSQESTASYGQSQQSTASYGLSQQSTSSYGQSQQSTASYGQSQQSTASYGQSQQSLMSYGQSQQSAVSYPLSKHQGILPTPSIQNYKNSSSGLYGQTQQGSDSTYNQSQLGLFSSYAQSPSKSGSSYGQNEYTSAISYDISPQSQRGGAFSSYTQSQRNSTSSFGQSQSSTGSYGNKNQQNEQGSWSYGQSEKDFASSDKNPRTPSAFNGPDNRNRPAFPRKPLMKDKIVDSNALSIIPIKKGHPNQGVPRPFSAVRAQRKKLKQAAKRPDPHFVKGDTPPKGEPNNQAKKLPVFTSRGSKNHSYFLGSSFKAKPLFDNISKMEASSLSGSGDAYRDQSHDKDSAERETSPNDMATRHDFELFKEYLEFLKEDSEESEECRASKRSRRQNSPKPRQSDERSSSPTHRARSSTHRARRPTHRARSSTHRARSPTYRARSSTHKASSATHRARSSTHKARSATHRTRSSTHRARSPTHHRASSSTHRARSRSPTHRAISPTHRAISPTSRARSPTHRASSSSHRAKSPRQSSLPRSRLHSQSQSPRHAPQLFERKATPDTTERSPAAMVPKHQYTSILKNFCNMRNKVIRANKEMERLKQELSATKKELEKLRSCQDLGEKASQSGSSFNI